jgi:chemotaxis protein histidine kinase CheA
MNSERKVKLTMSSLLAVALFGAPCAAEVAPDGAPEAAKKAETPAEKERSAIRTITDSLETQMEKFREEALKDSEVAQSRKTAEDAGRAFLTALQNNPEYKALSEKRARLEQTLAPGAADENADRRARGEAVMQAMRDWGEVRRKIAELPDAVPELGELKKKRVEAMGVFWDKLQEKLNANAEYVEAKNQLDEINAWTENRRNVEQGLARMRNFGFPGAGGPAVPGARGDRGDRGDRGARGRRGGAEAPKAAAPETKEDF